MDSKKGDLRASFHMAVTYLTFYKDEFIAKYGQECYDEHVKRYSVPAVEQTRLANIEKQKELAEKRRELDIREKELEVKMKYLSAETQIMNDKHLDKEKLAERQTEKEALERERNKPRRQKELEQFIKANDEFQQRETDPERLKTLRETRAKLEEELKQYVGEKEPQQEPHP